MIVKVNGKAVELPEGIATLNDLLEFVGVNRAEVVVVVNSEISIEEEGLKNGDEVKLISAVSGG